MNIRYCSVIRVAQGKVVEGRDYYALARIARQFDLSKD
jgi:ketosteroid isomerase-like protein